ncbi:MAG: hypothetical protein MJ061_02400, partial [Mailhella sp.]|nr:hypothetical protein [Mailhella sp.]
AELTVNGDVLSLGSGKGWTYDAGTKVLTLDGTADGGAYALAGSKLDNSVFFGVSPATECRVTLACVALGGPAACLAGLVCVGAESVSAVPAAFTDPSGLFPLALFPLCTVILGAAVSQMVQLGEPEDPAVRYGRFYMPLRICLWIMLVITALIPCIAWDDPLMKKSAFIWMQTQMYWMGVIFSGVVIGLSHMGRVTLIPQAVIAFVSVFGLRTAFYADSIHGIFDASTLYMK